MSKKVELNENEVIVNKHGLDLLQDEVIELRKANRESAMQLSIFHGMLELGMRNPLPRTDGMREDGLAKVLKTRRHE